VEKMILSLQVAAGTYCLAFLVSMLIAVLILILGKIISKHPKEEREA
jgi:hypothetical protein